MDVRWDPAAAQVLAADRGALTISDGDARREVELGAGEVGAGNYTYAPQSTDVGVRLTLFANGRTVAAESARVAGAAPLAAPLTAPAAETQDAAPLTAVHEIQPSVPDGIRSRIGGRIVIPVDVRINPHGRVVSARSQQSEHDGLHRYLAGLAENAARQWQFKPARGRGGSPVASGKRIEFVFTP